MRDGEAMPDIEQSAGLAFRAVPGLEWLADGDNRTAARYRDIVGQDWSWVAVAPDGRLAGFVAATVEPDAVHVWEAAVRLEAQGRGIGRRLFARLFAQAAGVAPVTLTTFRDVPWNQPFYRSLGFDTVEGDAMGPRLAGILAAEAEAGLPAERRCAMVRAVMR